MFEQQESFCTANFAHVSVHYRLFVLVTINSKKEGLYIRREGKKEFHSTSFFVHEKIELSGTVISEEAQGNRIDDVRFADNLARKHLDF